jgi:hypothetical protein
MTDERLKEIMDTARMILDAERGALNPEDDETERDVALSQWPTVVTQLRLAADMSSYDPNAMRWRRMADEFKAWAAAEDAREAAEMRSAAEVK